MISQADKPGSSSSVWGGGEGWNGEGGRLLAGSSKCCSGWWINGNVCKISYFFGFQSSNPINQFIKDNKDLVNIYRWKSHIQLNFLWICPFAMLRKLPLPLLINRNPSKPAHGGHHSTVLSTEVVSWQTSNKSNNAVTPDDDACRVYLYDRCKNATTKPTTCKSFSRLSSEEVSDRLLLQNSCTLSVVHIYVNLREFCFWTSAP